MHELSLLKALHTPETYAQYRNFLSLDDFPKELRCVIEALDAWYKTETTAPAVEDTANIVFARGVLERDRDYVSTVLAAVKNAEGATTVEGVLEKLKHNTLCQRLAIAAMGVVEGRSTVEPVLKLVEQLHQPVAPKVEVVTDDLDDILNEVVKTRGLRWRLNSLNKSLGSLRKGDFGFLFARPETGKTTFLASEVTHMAEQVTAGPILWFNNEEQGKKVKLRLYQAALGARLDQLLREPKRAREAYQKALGGRLLLLEAGGMSRHGIEALVHREKPSLIVVDQLDKVKGFKADRHDLELGDLYIWGRDMAKAYCPFIGVCQAGDSAEGERWLHMGHVANAKTSKQAEADWILGIGKTHEAGFDYIRFLNISKNKLTGDEDTDPSMRHAKLNVTIRPEIARYEDIE